MNIYIIYIQDRYISISISPRTYSCTNRTLSIDDSLSPFFAVGDKKTTESLLVNLLFWIAVGLKAVSYCSLCRYYFKMMNI